MKTRLYKNPPPYFIVLASSVKTKEVEVIQFHRIECSTLGLSRGMNGPSIILTLGTIRPEDMGAEPQRFSIKLHSETEVSELSRAPHWASEGKLIKLCIIATFRL